MKTIKNKLLMFAMLASGCSLQGAEGGAAAAGAAAEGLYPLDPSITDTELGLAIRTSVSRFNNIESLKMSLRKWPQEIQRKSMWSGYMMQDYFELKGRAEQTLQENIGSLHIRVDATKIDVKRLQEVVAVQQGQITALTETVAQQQIQIQEQRAQIGVLMTLFAARLGQGPA